MTDNTLEAEAAAALRNRKADDRRAGQKAVNAGRRRSLARFREENPGKTNLLISPMGIVFIQKPAGYDAFIIGLVHKWLTDPASTADSNVATIAKIQAQFPEHNFTERAAYDDLSKQLLDKIKILLDQHGVTLHKTAKTLAKIKKALRTSGMGKPADTRIQINCLLSSEHFGPFKVEDHKGRNCIRITSDGKRRRIYIDDIIALSGALAKVPGNHLPPPLSYVVAAGLAPETLQPSETREAAQDADDILAFGTASDTALSAGLAPETLQPPEMLECADENNCGVAPSFALSERFAAKRANQLHRAIFSNSVSAPTDEPPLADDFDPLCDL